MPDAPFCPVCGVMMRPIVRGMVYLCDADRLKIPLGEALALSAEQRASDSATPDASPPADE
jgi:hypothetical protein